jgi:hypothetical protein
VLSLKNHTVRGKCTGSKNVIRRFHTVFLGSLKAVCNVAARTVTDHNPLNLHAVIGGNVP